MVLQVEDKALCRDVRIMTTVSRVSFVTTQQGQCGVKVDLGVKHLLCGVHNILCDNTNCPKNHGTDGAVMVADNIQSDDVQMGLTRALCSWIVVGHGQMGRQGLVDDRTGKGAQTVALQIGTKRISDREMESGRRVAFFDKIGLDGCSAAVLWTRFRKQCGTILKGDGWYCRSQTRLGPTVLKGGKRRRH